MLTELAIKNVVLISELTLHFQNGLSALTGETGAGKSILLDSLGLALGHRAEAGLVRKGTDKAIVVAHFRIPSDHPLIERLHTQDIETDVENDTHCIILKRTLSKDGRSKAYINDQNVSVKFLSDIGAELVDIHGQFETHGLMNSKTHGRYLDLFGDYNQERARVAQSFSAWDHARKSLEAAQNALHEIEREEQWLRTSYEELDKLSPIDGEEEELLEKRKNIAHHANIVKGLNLAVSHLEGSYQDSDASSGAMPHIHEAIRSLNKIEDQTGQTVQELLTRLDQSYTELSDILSELKDELYNVETGDHSLDLIDERLHSYRVQARKHRCTADDLPTLLEELREKLALLDGQDGKIEQLQKATEDAREDYIAQCKILTEKRIKNAQKFDEKIGKELPALKLGSASFQTEISQKEERHWSENGMDHIAFMVRTNAGSSFASLDKSASGGELSRIMLALKVVLSTVSPVPVMIFDEVDSGMGGATAAALGDRLGALAENIQVLAVTHAPQIAARANAHMVVSKKDLSQDLTETYVALLPDHSARCDEIARMLSGAQITDEARAAANALMAQAHKKLDEAA